MITFPAWVNEATEDDDRASRRLRYMVMRAAIESTPKANIAALADLCFIDRTEIHVAMRNGQFSTKMAAKIEKACGRDVVRREWLVFPLQITELCE